MKIALFALLALLASPAAAQRASVQIVKACGLTGDPGSVTVEVYDDDAPGTLVTTIPNGDVSRIAGRDCYQIDIAAAAGIGYPAPESAARKGYTLLFEDDGGNEVEATAEVFGFLGSSEIPEFCKRRDAEYPSAPDLSRNITQAVINAGGVSYFTVNVACDQDFESPDFTYYEVYHYTADGKFDHWEWSDTAP